MTSVSTNPAAERLVGKRIGGIALNFPFEMGYMCPVCGQHGVKSTQSKTYLTWSEYAGFLYCKKCNLDIPSFFCLETQKFKTTKDRREFIQAKTDRYLEYVGSFRLALLEMLEQHGDNPMLSANENACALLGHPKPSRTPDIAPNRKCWCARKPTPKNKKWI